MAKQITGTKMNSSANNYQNIINSIEDGAYTVDLKWRITSFNKSAERITGIPSKKAIGKKCYEILKTSLCKDGCPLKKTIEKGKAISDTPLFLTDRDGNPVPVNASTAILKDDRNQPMGGVVTCRALSGVSLKRKISFEDHEFSDIISRNETILRYFDILPQIAKSPSTVLIEGKTGTGKEVFARAIHNNSINRNGPFIAVNCSAIPDTLVESELFGYKKGAFTDAKDDKPGRFKLAQNGTIFLDEIGDVSLQVQARLLRVLQEKCYEPLGGTTIGTNARIIAASNRSLKELVSLERFREDLYYRINIIRLSLPPLCERKDDLPLLIEHFIDDYNYTTGKQVLGLSDEAMTAMLMYNWPGNIRELENTIEHAFVLCPSGMITLDHLPDRFLEIEPSLVIDRPMTLKESEKITILKALKRNKWKKMATARELDIDKNTLRRKIIKHDIQEKVFDLMSNDTE